jgi:hypothetical protein
MCCCFDADTEIKLASGESKKIKDIRPGDKVVGLDNRINTVKRLMKPIKHFRNLYGINNGKPFTTAEHPFKTPTGWVSIKNRFKWSDPDTWANLVEDIAVQCKPLKKGMTLDNRSGKVKIEKITKINRLKDFFKPVYNLELDGNHTFYANNYLVHNKGGGGVVGKIIGGVTKVFKKTIGKIFDFIGDVIGFVFKPFGVPDIPDFSPENSASGVKLQKPGTNVGFPVIYGKRRVGSVPIFAETNGSDNQDLYVVYAICEGEIEGIQNIKVDGNTIGNSSGTYTAGQQYNAGYPYDGGRMVFQCFNGTENQSQSSLANGSASWGNAQRTLPGLAYVAARFRWIASTQDEADRNPFGGGIPQLEFDVCGKKVYDVTTHAGGLNLANDYDALTKTYSTNPANCLLDYLMNPRYGAGYGKEYINADSFKIAANKYNTEVVHDAADPSNSTAKIITCNGVLQTEAEILQNVKTLLSGCRTLMPFVQGRYKLKVEDGGHPTDITSSTVSVAFDVTAQHIVGQITLSGESKESKYNQVLVNYVDPDEEFSSQQEFFNTTGDLAKDDNETLTGEFTFETITNRATAKDFARLIYQKSRNQRTIAFDGTQELMNVEVGDIIRITDTILNLNQDTFRVVALSLQVDSTVRIEAVEHDATIYPHISTTQKEIAPPIFKPNSNYIYVRSTPQNPAPENYNNGVVATPPPLAYQSFPYIDQYGISNVNVNTHQLVAVNSFMLQNKTASDRLLLGGAVKIRTDLGYRIYNFNQTGQNLNCLIGEFFFSPSAANQFISQVIVDVYQGGVYQERYAHNIAQFPFSPRVPPGLPIIIAPGFPVLQYTPMRIPMHSSLEYKVFFQTPFSIANSSKLKIAGDISSWTGFTEHTYTVGTDTIRDNGGEGLVNYVKDNLNSFVTLFPNGSSFVSNTGGAVNLGG